MPAGIVVRDSALPGFSARKAKDGSITFRYRREGEPPVDRKLGTTKDAVTLSAARAAAEKLAAKRALGEWDATKPKFTVDDAWPIFREHLQRKTKSERTIGSYQSALDRMAPDLRATTLRALAEDPSLMAVEYDQSVPSPRCRKARSALSVMDKRLPTPRLDSSERSTVTSSAGTIPPFQAITHALT